MHARLLALAIVAESCMLAANASALLRLEVRPEVGIAHTTGAAYVVKIRLAASTTAFVWRDVECRASPSDAYVLDRSGTHAVPPDVLSRGSGPRLCVVSSDGALRAAGEITDAMRQTGEP